MSTWLAAAMTSFFRPDGLVVDETVCGLWRQTVGRVTPLGLSIFGPSAPDTGAWVLANTVKDLSAAGKRYRALATAFTLSYTSLRF